MVYSYWKIERYERIGDSSWSSTAIDISDAYDPVVRMSIGEGRDTFEFKLQNFNGEWNGNSLSGGSGFNIGDKIKIYYITNTSLVASSDLLMQGIVTNIPYETNASSNFIRIVGNNYSETLLSALVFYEPSTAISINSFLEGAINSIALFNDDFKVTWSSNNPTTKRDMTTSFPNTSEKWFYKSALKLMEEYSLDSKTQDGNYYWFINEDNEVVWQPKTDAINFSFNTATDEYKGLKVKKDKQGIVNFVIAKGGLDPKGASITVKRDDAISRTKHGFKYKLLTLDATTSNKMYLEDQQKGVGITNRNDSISSSNFPTTSGWISENTLSTVSSSTWNEYVENFRTEVKYRLKEQAKDYIDAHKNGKLQVGLEFSNGKGWSLGNVVNVTIPEITAVNKPMRIVDIEYTQNSESYTLEEDEGSI